jgi:hypothetical protein
MSQVTIKTYTNYYYNVIKYYPLTITKMCMNFVDTFVNYYNLSIYRVLFKNLFVKI